MSRSNETEDVVWDYVTSLMRLRVENLIFPIKTL